MKQLLYIRSLVPGNGWGRALGLLAVPLALAVLMSACAAPAPRSPTPPGGADAPVVPTEAGTEARTPADRDTLPPPTPAELSGSRPLKGKELGRGFVQVALHQFRFNTDYAVTSLVRRIGRDMVIASGDDPDRYHFFVVENPQANAFAIPGGYIFIFDGLLKRLHSEEELAGVMAHEVGHVRLAHFFKDQKKVAVADLAVIAAILLGQAQEAVTAFSLAGSASLQLAFSREHERQADDAALKYLREARYDGAGLMGFFETLSRQQRLLMPKGQYPYLSTHPGLDERAVRVQRRMERSEWVSVKAHDPMPWLHLKAVLAADSLARRPASGGDLSQGVALLTAARYGVALPFLQRAAEAWPGSVRAQVALGMGLLRLGHTVQALPVAVSATKLDPNHAPAHFLMGEVARQAGDQAVAKESYLKAIAADPAHPMSHFRLSELLQAAGDPWGDYHLARYLRLTYKPGQAMALLQGIDPGDDTALATAVRRLQRALLADGV